MSTNLQALKKWEEFSANLRRLTPVPKESVKEKENRIKKLERYPEQWFKYYFPNYYSCEPAPFHKRATKRLIKNKRHYEVRAWCRGLAKSTRAMMEVLYLALAKKEIRNILLVSHNYDNAEELLMPFMINLESNQRLINDYGKQRGLSGWQAGNFRTTGGISFRAIGARQSPRGTRNEHARPDMILIDDIDTDEICRNKERIKRRWEWVEQALIPTVDVGKDYRIVFLGNIIAKVSIINYAIKHAKYYEIINIRDKKGKSTWPGKNTEEDIDYMLSLLSYVSREKEFFNNPITQGTVFKEMRWGKVPPLRYFKFLVAYGDPSRKNSEAKSGDYKAVVLMGKYKGKYYIIRARLEQTTISKMCSWYFEHQEYVADRTPVYYHVEAGSLQETFYKDSFLPRLKTLRESRGHLNVKPDNRKKPDKFTRIEAALEPPNSAGELILNEKEKDCPHMQRLEEQFLAITPQLDAHDDGPDACEGAKWMIDKNFRRGKIEVGQEKRSKYKF